MRYAARSETPGAGLLGWLTDAALPLWASAGFDVRHERFEEARQVYAVAARNGWHPEAAALIGKAYASLVRDYHAPDGHAGWAFSIRRDGRVCDARRDLYAHAFVLLAIAAYVDATGERRALALADETLTFIERHMAAPQSGGFVEQLPLSNGIRRQNPHMHLFEALLGLWECSGGDPLSRSRRRALRPVRQALLSRRPGHPRRILHRDAGACARHRRPDRGTRPSL